MKKKFLAVALLAGIGMAQSAAAQTYDDRWYITAGMGVGFFDNEREVSDELYGTLGVGKFVTPNISIDAELWHSNPDLNNYNAEERNWELMSLSLIGRYHFLREGRDWHPYVSLGIGAQEHHDGTVYLAPALGLNESRTGTDLLITAGLGIQKDLGYSYIRAEVGARWDSDDESYFEDDSGYLDGYLGFSFVFPIGPEATPPPPPEPAPVKTCADLDDDGDGVNNCDDKCPGSQAGQAIGPDGCPVPVEPAPEPKPFRG